MPKRKKPVCSVCGEKSTFYTPGKSGGKSISCSKHADKKTMQKRACLCQHDDDCPNRAGFAVPGPTCARATHCRKHKTPEMKPFGRPMCTFVDDEGVRCDHQPTISLK